jgi:hypothetical protein
MRAYVFRFAPESRHCAMRLVSNPKSDIVRRPKGPFLISIGAVPWFSEPDAPGGIGLASPPFWAANGD